MTNNDSASLAWHRGPLVAFDTETTGVDPETSRICQAAVITFQDGPSRIFETLINPGVAMDESAQAVHGLTEAHLAEHGERPSTAVPLIVAALRNAWSKGLPVVIYNAPFDLTILDRELRRVHGAGLGEIGPVIDPMILDRYVDRYRKGSRKLAAVAKHYRVTAMDEGSPHTAATDARAAAQVAWRIANTYTSVGGVDLVRLQTIQVRVRASWAANFQAYLRSQGSNEEISPYWPMIPLGHRSDPRPPT